MSTQTEARAATDLTVETMTYREAVNAAMHDAFAEDASVVLLGEDVTSDGGVFKTNAGLPETYAERVFSTPICENGFTGVALGMAVMGMRPIVEIMFADFMPTAGDAIVNELPKYRYMSGGQFSVPVTLRVICGAGGRFGTQHSATGESWYMAQPGMRIAVAGTAGAAYELLRAAIRSNDPVIVHEHKVLYGRKGEVSRGTVAEIGRAGIERSGRDVALVIANEPLAAVIGELYRAYGYDVFAPETPLDVIQTLISADDRIGAVIISPDARWANGLCEFLGEEYPEIDRIVLAS